MRALLSSKSLVLTVFNSHTPALAVLLQQAQLYLQPLRRRGEQGHAIRGEQRWHGLGESSCILRGEAASTHSSKSSMYRPKRVGLRGQPCFTPMVARKQC